MSPIPMRSLVRGFKPYTAGLSIDEIREKYGEEKFMAWRRSYDTPPPEIEFGTEFSQDQDPQYADLGDQLPKSECLKDVVERFLKEVRPDEETFSMPVMKDSEGFGFTEAPRGSLMHFTKVRNGKIDNYQIVSATLWNCAPRNDTGMRGALEEVLIGVPVPDIENPVNIARLIRAFDP